DVWRPDLGFLRATCGCASLDDGPPVSSSPAGGKREEAALPGFSGFRCAGLACRERRLFWPSARYFVCSVQLLEIDVTSLRGLKRTDIASVLSSQPGITIVFPDIMPL